MKYNPFFIIYGIYMLIGMVFYGHAASQPLTEEEITFATLMWPYYLSELVWR